MAGQGATAPRRRSALSRAGRWLLLLLLAIVAVIVLAAVVLDSDAGRRFIIDRIEQLAPENGLKIRIGRIEGSIYNRATVRDVRLYDPEGEFLRIAEARLDWRPLDFLLSNRLGIDSLDVPRASLARLPELIPSADDKPILPDFDIALGRLTIDRLQLGAAIAGQAHVARIAGRADVRNGTADIDLDARLLDGNDRLTLDLLVVPDRQEFDVDADIVAPAGGVLASIAGLPQGVTGVVRGDGDWRRWTGALLADSAGSPLARLRLTASDGRYAATGRIRPDLLADGIVDRLTAGGIALDAAGTIADRRWDGRVALVGRALQLDATGGVDLAQSRFLGLRTDVWLRRPGDLLDTVDGQNARASVRLDGAFSAPRFEYRLTAPWLALGRVRLDGIEASGTGIGGGSTIRVPLDLKVTQILGIGALAEGIVRDLRADGVLAYGDSILTADSVRFRSAGLSGRMTARADVRTGDIVADVGGALPALEIRGLGQVDLVTSLDLRRSAGGPLGVAGNARATIRRLDNGFLRTLTGGLPVVASDLALASDGIIRFSNLSVTSPLLTLAAQGIRRRDGTVQLTGQGVHRTYGPVTVSLDGPIGRPRATVLLASPLDAAGLSDVRLDLVPAANGFDFTARGGSLLGLFTGDGRILLPRGGSAVVDMQRLTVGGTMARGRIAVVQGGLVGRLLIAGGGLDGTVSLSVPAGLQQIRANLRARDASFAGPPPIAVRRGQLDATILLDPRGTDVEATFEGTGIRRGTLSIARVAWTARLVDGRGSVRGSIAGTRGRGFGFQFAAAVSPGRYRISGTGTLAERPLRLTRAAVIRRDGDQWRLDPAELTYAGGRVRLSGAFGGGTASVDAALDNVPLSLLDLAYPTLGLGGRANGRLTYADGAGSPSGTAQLRLANFTRAGLTEGSAPLDIGLNATLTPSSMALRAIVEREGRTIGRIQARTAPLVGGDDLVRRIIDAPLVANLRYNGEIGTLWRLSGIEGFALSGPVSITADATGSIADPQIRGALRANGARFESFQTGTVVTHVSAIGRFDGSRLQLRSIAGETAGGGTVTGEGDFNLAAADGFGMDLRLRATDALLIRRDDLTARVTGPARLFSTGRGGSITGNFTMTQGSFRLGRATAAEALPVINVVERNAPADRAEPRRPPAPWNLNVRVRAPNNFAVTGLGLESEWSADVAVTGPVNDFAIAGQARLVRGDYNFAGRRFEVREGEIRFTGQAADPVLDIVAVSDVTGIDAQIRIRGTGQRPEISFSSIPALPEDELLSRILFGSSITDISVTEAAQLGVALASLRSGGDGLDPINAIRRATGLDRLRILPANTELGSGTSIAAGKYLTRRVFVEIITDGQGYSATRAEYQVTRWLAILAAISTLNDESINVRIKRDY